MAFRHTAVFCSDWRPHSRILDRNERAKVLFLAEALERRTKPEGRRNGQLGYVGLAVLRALMFGFLNHKTGLCCPGYAAMQAKTGLCRASIANGLARLERTGIVQIVRRLVRQRVDRVSPVTGLPETYVGTTQATNLYSLHPPGPWADELERPAGRRAPFPTRRQLSLLEALSLSWQQSSRGREKPNPTRKTRGVLVTGMP
jgi:hypothetical protein